MQLLPTDRTSSSRSVSRPSSSAMRLLYRVRTVSCRSDSRPSMRVRLLKERSSQVSEVRCERFSIFSMMLLSSCSFVSFSKPCRLSIRRIFCERI